MGEKTFFSVEIRGRRAKKSFSEAGPEDDVKRKSGLQRSLRCGTPNVIDPIYGGLSKVVYALNFEGGWELREGSRHFSAE